MNEIASNFQDTTKKTLNEVSKAKSKEVAIIKAGTNLFSHYIDAKEKNIILGKDLNDLKNIIQKDVNTIDGDLGRLILIHKVMNEIHFPKAEAFYSYCDSVFTNEFKSLEDLIYTGDELKVLKNRRNEIMKECSKIKMNIFDIKSNISINENDIESYKNSIQILEPDYKNSIFLKPIKPNSILNFISFGLLNKKYSKKIYFWDQEHGFSVNRFEVDILT